MLYLSFLSFQSILTDAYYYFEFINAWSNMITHKTMQNVAILFLLAIIILPYHLHARVTRASEPTISVIEPIATPAHIIALHQPPPEPRMPQAIVDKNLMTAVKNGEVYDAEEAINNGAQINFANSKGWTPLTLACKKQDLLMVNMLIMNDADINLMNAKLSIAPLIIACQLKNYDIVRLLLENGACPNTKYPVTGINALHIACRKNTYEIIKILLEHQAIVDSVVYQFVWSQNFSGRQLILNAVALQQRLTL